MSSRQKKYVWIVMAGVLLIWIISYLAGSHGTFDSRSTAPPGFDAGRARRDMVQFVTGNPNRVFGSFDSRHASGYLRDFLKSLGYETDFMPFGARIGGRREAGRNVLGYRQGKLPEIIAIVAHYDTAKTTIQGAMADGSGVGVLMEIARLLSKDPAGRSTLIVFTDGGEWGMSGALDLATRYAERGRIAAVLSLDYVGIGELAALRLEETGLQSGFTPPWLRILASRAAEEQGLPVEASSGFREHAARTFYMPLTDQGPFLGAGIPAVNLGSRSVDRTRERAVYHSPEDTIGNLSPSGIEAFGRAAERIVRSLDELPAIPREPMGSFQVRPGRFLGPVFIRILHCLLMLPLPLCLCFQIRNHHRSFKPRMIVREILAFLVTLFPFLTIYFSTGLFRKLRMLPLYDLYPATAKDPVLLNPPWGILGGIFGTALVIAALCTLFFMFGFRDHPKQNHTVTKPVLLCLMLLTVLASLVHNSYWAVSFLALPCWIWSMVGKSRNRRERLLLWILIPAAAVPGLTVVGLLASRLYLGVNILWYQILALNTGLFSAPGFFLAAAVAALGVRFMVLQLHE